MPSSDSVLFITRKWGPAIGGMETYAEQLVSELKKTLTVTVCKPEQCVSGRTPISTLLKLFLNAIRTIHTSKYKHYHLCDASLYPLAFFIKWLHGTSSYITFHGLDLQLARQPSPLGYLYRLYLWPLRYAPIKMTFPNSAFTCALAQRYALPTKTIVLATRLPITSYNSRPRSPFKIFFVGRLIERKGILWFAQQVLPQLRNVELHVIGPAQDPRILSELLKIPRVTYHGAHSGASLESLRAQADMFIVPNITKPVGDGEGFGLVCIENATYGVPVLASQYQGIIDAVINHKTGILLPPDFAPSWIQTIQSIQAWSPEQFLDYAQTVFEYLPLYRWDRVTKEVIQAYNI